MYVYNDADAVADDNDVNNADANNLNADVADVTDNDNDVHYHHHRYIRSDLLGKPSFKKTRFLMKSFPKRRGGVSRFSYSYSDFIYPII